MSASRKAADDAKEVPLGIRADQVTAWFREHIEGVAAPLDFEVIVGGHSNLTYKVTDASERCYVLRRPPLGAVLATAHDMAREHRILTGVGKTSVPVPPVLGLCEDDQVNDAPFYVMEYVEGHVFDTQSKVEEVITDESIRRRLGLETADVLAELHKVNPDDVGLGTLGKKPAYLDRQLKRWRIQWENSKTRELAAMEEAHELLVAAKPEQRYTGIVHGDYRLGNMLSRTDGTVAAVLDWELCTLGDVMADLGYVLNNWVEPGEREQSVTDRAPSMAAGFPTRAQWLARYAEKSGFDVGDVEYYRAFQHWRLAAICEGVLARYLKGVMADQDFDTDTYVGRVDWMANRALDIVRGL